MSAPETTCELAALSEFVARPAYGSTELHLSSVFVPHQRAAASRMLDDLVGGGESYGNSERPRHWVVSWVGPMGVADQRSLDRTVPSNEIHRICVSAARNLRVGLRYWREANDLVGTSLRAGETLFVGRQLPDAADTLELHARVLDVADRFELRVARRDVPGRIGRKVLRRSEEEVFDQVLLQDGWLQVVQRSRSSDELINLPVADLQGIVRLRTRPLCITADAVIELPSFVGSPKHNTLIQHWTYARVLQRLGM